MLNEKAAEEKERLDQVTAWIIGAAIEVHRTLGPGLLESAYEAALERALDLRSLAVERQRKLPVEFRGVKLARAYRLDLVVQDSVVVEVKTLERVLPVHRAQLRSYLRLSGYKIGLLLNFRVPMLKAGIHRLVNGYPEAQASPRSPLPPRPKAGSL